LHLSVALNSYYFVKTLVDKGCKTETRTWDNDTALSLALRAEKYDIVKLLINEIMDFENFRDKHGKS